MQSRALRIFVLSALTLVVVGAGLALALGSDKATVIAAGPKGECSATVSGAEALTSALSSAPPGSVLCLAARGEGVPGRHRARRQPGRGDDRRGQPGGLQPDPGPLRDQRRSATATRSDGDGN